jgi:hypothetical protein
VPTERRQSAETRPSNFRTARPDVNAVRTSARQRSPVGISPSRASSSLKDAHPRWRDARAGPREATASREDARARHCRVLARLKDEPGHDNHDRARSEDVRASQEDASLCDGRVPLCLEDVRASQEDASLCDGRVPLCLEDAPPNHRGVRLGDRDASLRPIGPLLSFRSASFAPRPATLRVREPPEERFRQALLEAVARVHWRDVSSKLERWALSRRASSSSARDPVHTTVRPLLEDRTT